jgi:hypothetical protein
MKMTDQVNHTANTTRALQAEIFDDELELIGHVFDLGASRSEIQWLVPNPWTRSFLYLDREPQQG